MNYSAKVRLHPVLSTNLKNGAVMNGAMFILIALWRQSPLPTGSGTQSGRVAKPNRELKLMWERDLWICHSSHFHSDWTFLLLLTMWLFGPLYIWIRWRSHLPGSIVECGRHDEFWWLERVILHRGRRRIQLLGANMVFGEWCDSAKWCDSKFDNDLLWWTFSELSTSIRTTSHGPSNPWSTNKRIYCMCLCYWYGLCWCLHWRFHCKTFSRSTLFKHWFVVRASLFDLAQSRN